MTGALPHILVGNIFFAPFSYGGATVVAEEVARALQDQGRAHISAVSLIARAEIAAYTVIRSQVNGIDNYLVNMPPGRSFQEFWDNPRVEQVLEDLIRQIAPDLFHAHCIQEMGIGALRAADRCGVPIILSVHDFWWICERQFMVRMDNVYCGQFPVDVEGCKGCVSDHTATRKRFYALRETASLAQTITYPSNFALELCESSGLAPGRGVVWENGVRLPSPSFFERQKARRERDPRLVFGFLGGPSQIKGWPTIRAAFEKLDRTDFRVDLVDGSNDGSWWRGYDFSDLPGEWRIVPRFSQAQMDDFYVNVDVLLFMSQWKETFGLAIREALARGIDVIQTDSGGTTEHPAADPARLIPIGAPPDMLVAQLEDKLETPRGISPPQGISSFEDQATAFSKLAWRHLDHASVAV